MEKQVILSKTEFDKMEEELKTLNEIVDSKKISALAIPIQNWSYDIAKVNKCVVHYILDIEEHDVVKTLELEIKRLDKELNLYKDRIWKSDYAFNNLRDRFELERSKPWYKKIGRAHV